MQKELNVEGSIKSNKTIESLNTSIFQDTGNDNKIVIDIKGTINLEDNQKLITSYNQIKNIPIKIRKNGNLNTGGSLSLKIMGLNEIACKRKDLNGNFVTAMPQNAIKNDDLLTATYNGSFFIVTGDSFIEANFPKPASDTALGTVVGGDDISINDGNITVKKAKMSDKATH